MSRTYRRVFAVVRIDFDFIQQEPALSVKVVSVFEDEMSASEDARRLNHLNADKGAKYYVQSAHWRPREG